MQDYPAEFEQRLPPNRAFELFRQIFELVRDKILKILSMEKKEKKR